MMRQYMMLKMMIMLMTGLRFLVWMTHWRLLSC